VIIAGKNQQNNIKSYMRAQLKMGESNEAQLKHKITI
jgi:hypothetical protein